MAQVMSLFRAFLRKRESVYLWINLTDLLLTLIRNGAAYAYLLWLTLTTGMSAAEFLLYFTAASGFTQWVTGILDMFNQLHGRAWTSPRCGNIWSTRSCSGLRTENLCPRTCPPPANPSGECVLPLPKAEKDTLQHINLTIHPGEKLAIVGLNGAGKTTLVRLVLRISGPHRGPGAPQRGGHPPL